MIDQNDLWFKGLLNGTTLRTSRWWPQPALWIDMPDGSTLLYASIGGGTLVYSRKMHEEIVKQYGPDVDIREVVKRAVHTHLGIRIEFAIPYRWFPGDGWIVPLAHG